MAREYVEKNTAEMVRCLKELVAIPGIFEDAPSKGAPFGKNIQKSLEYVLRMGQQMGFRVKIMMVMPERSLPERETG